MDRLHTGSDFLSVIRGHDGVSLREVVKRSSEVHHCALLSEGIGNVVCSIMSCRDQHIGWDVSSLIRTFISRVTRFDYVH